MRERIVFRCMFLVLLLIILIGLIYILFDRSGTRTGIYMPPIVDYKIVYDTSSEECEEMLEEIYRDDKYIYSLPCKNSSKITILWDDGVEEPLKYSIEKEKVSMESLEEHGLKIHKSKK
ncbi:MAG: hypothetical protein IKR57_02210 [Bacilli bacterium]|nr:hypothetical protein [Bacilli bacterium]